MRVSFTLCFHVILPARYNRPVLSIQACLLSRLVWLKLVMRFDISRFPVTAVGSSSSRAETWAWSLHVLIVSIEASLFPV